MNQLKRLAANCSKILLTVGSLAILVCPIASSAKAEQPAGERILAFPGAEGAGAYAVGGRFGSVYRVTNLNASGSGSLADAVSKPNRIIVFTVSGTIDLSGGRPGRHGSLLIEQPHITIAGQSAPGEGICLKNGGVEIKAGDVIVRYIRSRRGYIAERDTGDAFDVKPPKTAELKTGEGTTSEHFEKVKAKKEARGKVMKVPGRIDDIMLDHLSASWATDENLTMTHANNSTMQYCIAAEGLDYANPKQTPPNHSEGSLWGVSVADGRSTLHHTLYAHNRLRNPRTTGGTMPPAVLEAANNVIYDCSEYTSATGGEAVYLNWFDNYYKPGPSTPAELRPVMFTFVHSPDSRMFAQGNVVEGFPAADEDNWLAVRFEKGLAASDAAKFHADKPFDTPALHREPARVAYEHVLADSGASLPSRDPVDLRLVNDVRHGTGHVINKETDLAPADRWPEYHSLPAPPDTNGDGIPDYWKQQFGLSLQSPGDAMKIAAGGYANIEHYLNNTDPAGSTTPIVYIHATVSRAHRSAAASAGQLQIDRTGPTSQPLIVHFSLEGTAGAQDFAPLPDSIVIAAGQRSAVLSIEPTAAQAGGVEKLVVVRLQLHADAYHVGCPSASMVAIGD